MAATTWPAAAPKTWGKSATPAPCAPIPGASIGPLRAPKRSAPAGVVAPTTTPKSPTGCRRALRPATASTTDCATVLPVPVTAACTSTPSGLEVNASTNTPRPVRPASSNAGFQRTDPEVGRHGDRVGNQRGPLTQVGGGVSGHGGTDVAPLDIEQHQRTGVSRRHQHPLQHRDAPRPMPLEERRLRLDQRHLRRQRLHRTQRESLHPPDIITQPPPSQQFWMRINPRTQRPPGRHDAGQPRPEPALSGVIGHRRAPLSLLSAVGWGRLSGVVGWGRRAGRRGGLGGGGR